MKGWKTWLAGALMALLGVYEVSEGKSDSGMMRISEALAIVGLGHKIEKLGK